MNKHQQVGYLNFFVIKYASLNLTMVFSLDYSNFSTMSDVKTYQIASIDTADPQIKIVLSFEVTRVPN